MWPMRSGFPLNGVGLCVGVDPQFTIRLGLRNGPGRVAPLEAQPRGTGPGGWQGDRRMGFDIVWGDTIWRWGEGFLVTGGTDWGWKREGHHAFAKRRMRGGRGRVEAGGWSSLVTKKGCRRDNPLQSMGWVFSKKETVQIVATQQKQDSGERAENVV